MWVCTCVPLKAQFGRAPWRPFHSDTQLPLPGHNLLSHGWCFWKINWAISQLHTWPLAIDLFRCLGCSGINHPVRMNFQIYLYRVKQSILLNLNLKHYFCICGFPHSLLVNCPHFKLLNWLRVCVHMLTCPCIAYVHLGACECAPRCTSSNRLLRLFSTAHFLFSNSSISFILLNSLPCLFFVGFFSLLLWPR